MKKTKKLSKSSGRATTGIKAGALRSKPKSKASKAKVK